MKISSEKVVSVTYTLTLDNGAIADQADDQQPFLFIHGVGQTLPAFDDALNGMVVGDGFKFTLTAEQSYGMPNADWLISIPKSVFSGPDVPEDILEVGAVLPMQDQSGNPMDGKVVEIGEEEVKMDFNHPLAGESLRFVRPAQKSWSTDMFMVQAATSTKIFALHYPYRGSGR